MKYCDVDKLEQTAAAAAPFPHLLCENFVCADSLAAVHRDFPRVPAAGSFPLAALKCGDAFAGLVEEARGGEVTRILAEKLKAPILHSPTMATVRGFCRDSDGKTHLDSNGKLITVLLYLNRKWSDGEGGRLRLLNGKGDDINDYFLETPPGNGTLLAFRCDDNAWHGHLPFNGERRSIQLNWVESRAYQRREGARHFVSAFFKKVRAAARRAA